jgi:hypothetical protein
LGDKGGRCVGLTTFPPSHADCLEIWEPQPPAIPTVCPDRYTNCSAFIHIYINGLTSLIVLCYRVADVGDGNDAWAAPAE